MSSGLKEKWELNMGDSVGEGVYGRWDVGVMDRAGDRGGASRPAPPGPGSGDTGKGDRGSGWIRCPVWPREPGCPAGFPAPPYIRNRAS